MARRPDLTPRLDPVTRVTVLATAALALLPLLLQLPLTLVGAIVGVGGVAAVLSWRKPLPSAVRFLLSIAMLAAVLWLMGARFGRDTGCALLAAMLAIKPTETSTVRDGRSLLGFALFAPFAAFLLDQGPTTMVLGLAALVTALLALQQLTDLESGLPPAPVRTRLGGIGKLLLIGLPLALAAFWLFPRLASPLWGIPDRALTRPGLSNEMTPGGWLDFMADDTPAARVQFFGPIPRQREMYWRGPVLWDFDGLTWTQPRDMRGIGPAPTQRAKAQWDYQLEMEPTDRHQVIALDLPVSAPEGTVIAGDQGLYTERTLSALTRWRIQSSAPTAFEPELAKFRRVRALSLPPGFNPRTVALGQQWRADAGAGAVADAAIVNRAMKWIRAEFAYTLVTEPSTRDLADQFLFRDKQGYCAQFSSSFVILMRAAGIPSRVVTGYAGGERNPVGGYWVVRNLDAHAWAEVWLDGRGWVRVDPTATVAPERIYDTINDRESAGGADEDGLARVARFGDYADFLRRNWNDLLLGFDAGRQSRMLQGIGIDRLDAEDLGLLFGGFTLLALGVMAWLLARGERERDPLLRAWHRLERRYRRFGLGRAPHEPAMAWALRVAEARPNGSAALLALTRRFNSIRYAGATQGVSALVQDLRRHRP